MNIKTTKMMDDAVQHEFELEVVSEYVPAVLWTPTASTSPKALIALGHGGAQHKTSDNIVQRAVHYATTFQWASLAIDAPGHGERITPEEAERNRVQTQARLEGKSHVPALSAGEKIRYLETLAAQAVPEWQAAITTVLESDFVNADIPLAYWGMSMGSNIGIPLLAADIRFSCAVLGLAHLHPDHASLKLAAQQINIPLRFVFQWDDIIRDRDYGLALFDAFGSQQKSMHINPGGHTDVPAFEVQSWDVFVAEHIC
ncbi:MAG: alpha/beta hydrolase [Deinococcota bacterium]